MRTAQKANRVSWSDYQQLARMNASTLVHGCKSMRALKQAMTKGFVETRAMEFGSQYHALLLEPEEFELTHCVMPDFANDPRNVTKTGIQSTSAATEFCKKATAQFLAAAEHEGKAVITRKNYDLALAMIESIHCDERAVELLDNSEREVTLTGEIEGVPCKGRLDLLDIENGVIGDLKGCKSAAPYRFGKDAANLRYDFKMAFYRELVRQNYAGFFSVEMIAVETGGELDCCVQEMHEPILEQGWDDVVRVLREYRDSKATDVWPGVNRGRKTVPMVWPNWAMRDGDDEVPYEPEE